MKTYIAILRGINVSGKNKIPMAELRDLLSRQGWQNLQTYIQSGNVVFQATAQQESALADTISVLIADHFGYQVPVLVMTDRDIAETVAENPFPNLDLTKLHVTFLAEVPDTDLVKVLPPSPNNNEMYRVTGRWVYVYCPDGYGNTKINNMFFEKKLKVTATTRNWKSCLKLLEMSRKS